MKKLVSVFILLLITSICINAQEAGFPILTNPYPDQNLSEITPQIIALGIDSKVGVQSKNLIAFNRQEIIHNNKNDLLVFTPTKDLQQWSIFSWTKNKPCSNMLI